jgi:urease accessory protein UreE
MDPKTPPLTWLVRPRSRRELLTLCIELGNLHVPVEITGAQVRVAPDGPVQEVLERMNLEWETR